MKNKSLHDSIKDRRTYYQLSNQSPISDAEIQKIIEHVAYWAPSPFNSQSARMVLLLGENHKKLWEQLHGSLGKPYNYYPRGRVDADNKGQPVIYMSPHVPPALLPEIQAVFAITSQPLLRYDNSRHYRCHLDDGWGW